MNYNSKIRTTLNLGECPRCAGDIRIETDHYGTYKACLQCGYNNDLTEKAFDFKIDSSPLCIRDIA